ncbi:MAG: hemerythrin domain-containing protein [Rhodobacteraceae bacterium]|nr:hemerythrin domain-containing protein [Paracoccaceae bacterium]
MNAPQSPAELTRFIETHYHAQHRIQLPALAKLAEKIEAVHFGDEQVPQGLSDLLHRMIGELEVHMKKEELILFPAIRSAATGLGAPVAAMRNDHDDHASDIARIGQLTNGLTPPDDACASWTRLYAELGDFISELEAHIRLENEVLFPQVETA